MEEDCSGKEVLCLHLVQEYYTSLSLTCCHTWTSLAGESILLVFKYIGCVPFASYCHVVLEKRYRESGKSQLRKATICHSYCRDKMMIGIKGISKDLCVAWASGHSSASGPPSVYHKMLQFLSIPASLPAAVEEMMVQMMAQKSHPGFLPRLYWPVLGTFYRKQRSILCQPLCLWGCFNLEIFGRARSSVSAPFRVSTRVPCCLALQWSVRWWQWKPWHSSWWCSLGRRRDKGRACSSFVWVGLASRECNGWQHFGGEGGTGTALCR